MALERTISIIKPDATRRNLTGKINAKFEDAGLRVVAQKRILMTKAQAGVFYGVHAERPFYDELCEFMSSEPVVVQVLEGENAIAKNREVMGATNQQMQRQAQCAPNLPSLWAKTLYMALMPQRPQLLKSRISFLASNWLAKL